MLVHKRHKCHSHRLRYEESERVPKLEATVQKPPYKHCRVQTRRAPARQACRDQVAAGVPGPGAAWRSVNRVRGSVAQCTQCAETMVRSVSIMMPLASVARVHSVAGKHAGVRRRVGARVVATPSSCTSVVLRGDAGRGQLRRERSICQWAHAHIKTKHNSSAIHFGWFVD